MSKLDLPTGTKSVYLQRGPRAIDNSRKKHTLCMKEVCRNISMICKEREEDLRTLEKWCKKSITLVRYEDLATNPLPESERLFRALGLNYTSDVKSFVKAHTNDASQTNDRYSTHRNSTAAATRWKSELEATEVEKIQKACRYVIERAG